MEIPPFKGRVRAALKRRNVEEEKVSEPEEVDDEETSEEDEEAESEVLSFDSDAMSSKIEKLLKFSTFEPEHTYWLNTGYRELNSVFGAKVKGIPYGKIFELAGRPHGGKTAVSLIVGSLAQQDGAAVGYVDFENSRDPIWAEKLGLKWSGVYPIYQKLILDKPPKEKKAGTEERKGKVTKIPRLMSAEEMFVHAERAMQQFADMGFKKQFWLIDSVAMIQTKMMIVSERNMRAKLDRAAYLSEILPKWAGLAANYNAMVFLVNQIRVKPNQMFGDPTYTPGGNALEHACSIRARIRRVSNGRLTQAGKTIGIIGVIKNIKNKAGGGSEEQGECGYMVRWDKAKAQIKFMPVSEVKALKGEGDADE